MNSERLSQSRERLYDLLADRATEGLSPTDSRELERLIGSIEDDVPVDCIDRVVAALDRPSIEPLPDRLVNRLFESAERYYPTGPVASVSTKVPRNGFNKIAALSGWSVAAALLVALVWTNRGIKAPISTLPTPVPPPSIAERKERLAADPVSQAAPFRSKQEDALRGEVVWSSTKQEGYLLVSGLKPNDPKVKQYQLWIVDEDRKSQPPVDGGVFDVGPDGSALVPIRNPIPVRRAVLFAVTEEEPGGVVVSEDGKKGKFVVAMGPVAR